MIKMWLDDYRPAPIGWTHVLTVEAAQALLVQGNVEEASLDHDLGACTVCISRGEHVGDMATPETTFYNHCPHVLDGTSLCNWMAETGHWPLKKPRVHSANPVGAARMRGIIDRYCPN